MANTAGLGIDDKHVLVSAMQTLEEVSPLLTQHLNALLGAHTDTGRLLAEIESTCAVLRPQLVANTSPDRWYEVVNDDLDQVWELVDKSRRQVELLDAARQVCRRVSALMLTAA